MLLKFDGEPLQSRRKKGTEFKRGTCVELVNGGPLDDDRIGSLYLQAGSKMINLETGLERPSNNDESRYIERPDVYVAVPGKKKS